MASVGELVELFEKKIRTNGYKSKAAAKASVTKAKLPANKKKYLMGLITGQYPKPSTRGKKARIYFLK